MAILDQLEPKRVFSWFEQLCAIPHGSRNTKQVSDWLVQFAADRGLEHYQDELNNVIIRKAAAPGYEAAAPLILQGHMDMVCERAPDCGKDMEREGLELFVEGDLVGARGTTLGGDDGIAVAMMLALLDADDIPYPPLECVFTVDEEIGMLGAVGLDVSPLRGRRMLNIDSEAEGVFTVSCAGGRVVNCVLPLRREGFLSSGAALRIEISGLIGGHSGVEIHKGRANASMLLGRVLYALKKATALRIVSVEGGLKDNAIPVRAAAQVVVGDAAAAERVCREMEQALRVEYAVTDPGVSVRMEPGVPETPMDADSTLRVLCLLQNVLNGVQAMSPDVAGLVQTSLNLGILTTSADRVEAAFCVRSSVESQKLMLTDRLQCLTEQLGGTIEISGDYPGWAFRRESPLRDLLTEVYREQYGKEPVVDAIHAGVECGLFAGKIPDLDCVSIGPDLSEIHTFRERLHVASTQRTWALVLETLKRMKA